MSKQGLDEILEDMVCIHACSDSCHDKEKAKAAIRSLVMECVPEKKNPLEAASNKGLFEANGFNEAVDELHKRLESILK